MKLKKEKGVEMMEDLGDDRSTLVQKETRIRKLIYYFYMLVLSSLLSNSAFFCYFFMVICMIMNGSMLSLVYPISIFIYALLEEKRPVRYYWILIMYYTSIVLVLKFIFQTYPFSSWITANFAIQSDNNNGEVSNLNSFNDIFRTMRLGLENVEDSGRNFAKYFLFETLILFSVTFHILILIIGGVWSQREVEAESLNQAASRIASLQKLSHLKENEKGNDFDCEFTDEISLEVEKNIGRDSGVIPNNFKELTLRRKFSMND